MKKAVVPIIFLLLISSCTKRVDLGDFDAEKWRLDVNGCSGERALMIDDLIEAKPNLLGLYQKKIIKALGAPEEQELYKRSQTYYVYYIDPAGTCADHEEDPRILEIRFTSLGIANEVNIK